MRRLARMRELEVWIAWVRLGGVLFAFLEVGIFAPGYPGNYEAYASATTGVFAVGAMALWQLTRRAYRPVVGLVALVFDLCVIAAYSTVYSYAYGAPTRWALILVVIEGALRYGLRGGVSLSVVPSAVPRLPGVVAGARVRWPALHHRPRHLPVRHLRPQRDHRRLARSSPRRGGRARRRAGPTRPRAARPARPAGRCPRGGQSMCPRARVVARGSTEPSARSS